MALDDDDMEAGSDRTGAKKAIPIQSSKGPRCNATTLFVDVIEEAIWYHHIRGLFSLFGSISRVFVQRNRNLRRRFRFGFVRFLSQKQASDAIDALHGLKGGGAALSVAPARFPREVV